jgi:hypothetical protein
MATTVPIPAWKQYFRVSPESAYSTTAASADWNIGGNGGGAIGYRDMAVIPGTGGLTPNVNNIFVQYAAGKRGMNQQAPIEGATTSEGTLELPMYPELIDPFLHALMGTTVRTPTAGAAALASTAFASVATLDTQPDGTEVLKFVIASSTAASGASINIIQSAATVETITIGTSATSVDGDYYSKGAYDGSSNAITFTIAGTVTGGMVVISGIDKVSNVHTVGTSAPPTLQIEEGGHPRTGSNSHFYAGMSVVQANFAFDRSATDNMAIMTPTFAGELPTATTATTYGNDPKTYYNPLAGWTASLTLGGSAFSKVVSMNFDIIANNNQFAIASGNQQPSGVYAGAIEVAGTMTILPEDNTEWAANIAQTVGNYELTFTSPQSIVDSDKWTLLFEFTETYFETYATTVTDGLFTADIAFKTLEHASDHAVKITGVNRMPV